MANLFGGFNANDVAPMDERKLLPPGEYVAWIIDSEMKATKLGDGQMLKLTFDIIDGEHKGNKLFENLNLVNPNPVAVEMAQRALSSICRAVGVMTPEDSEQLHTIPMVIKVAVVVDSRDKEKAKANPNDPTINYQNSIKNYAPYQAGGTYQKPSPTAPVAGGGGAGGFRQPQQVNAPAQGFTPTAPTGATGNAKPWAR